MHKLEQLYNETAKRFNNDLNIIIQAFINFYGVENSEYIINKISNSRIIWYDDSNRDDDIQNQIISSINGDELTEILKKRKKEAFLQSAYIVEIDVLILPLNYDLTHIIHEINHKIGSHIISIEPLIQISGISYSVEKNGIVEYDNDLNEAINQKMTLEILEELNKLGLKINITASWQEQLFPVIDSFYATFKEQLKNLNISGDLVAFKEKLGKEYFDKFSQLVFMCGFRARRSISKGEEVNYSIDRINTINDLVSNMKIHSETLSLTTKKSGAR